MTDRAGVVLELLGGTSRPLPLLSSLVPPGLRLLDVGGQAAIAWDRDIDGGRRVAGAELEAALERFVRLPGEDPQGYLAFAQRFGVLGLCAAHRRPLGHGDASVASVLSCWPGHSLLHRIERVDDWQMWATYAAGLMRIRLANQEQRAATYLEWRAVMELPIEEPGAGLEPMPDRAPKGWTRPGQDIEFEDREGIAYAVNQWLRLCEVRPILVAGDDLELRLGGWDLTGSLLPLLGVQLATTLARVEGAAFCRSCGKPFLPKVRGGKRAYCFDCGTGAAVRSKAYRRRQREKEAPGHPSPGVEDEVVGLLLSAWKGDEQGIVVPVKRLQAALRLVEPKPDRAVRQIFEVVKRCHILALDGGVVDSGVRDANMALAATKMGVLYLRRALSLLSDAQSSVRSGNDIGNVLPLVFAELAAGGGSSPREQGASGIGLGQLPTVVQAPPLAAAGPVLDPSASVADESAVAAAPAEPPRASPGAWLDGGASEERDDEAEQKLEREWWWIQRRVQNKGHARQSFQVAHSGFTVRGRVVMIYAQSAAVADELTNWKQQVILDEEIRRVVGRSIGVRFAFDPQGTVPKVDAPEDPGHYN